MKLAFRIGSIPVTVHGTFLFLMLVLAVMMHGQAGFDETPTNEQGLLMVVCAVSVFLSVLLHELGHALTGKLFGLAPRIDLHGMGGTTSWPLGERLSNFRQLLISVAGPLVGVLLGGALLMRSAFGIVLPGTVLPVVVRDIIFFNLGWGLFNLLPMMPLDGGNVMRAMLNGMTSGRGDRPARLASIAVGTIVAVAAITWLQSVWIMYIAATSALSNWQALRRESKAVGDAPLRQELEQAYDALNRGDTRFAIRTAEGMLSRAESPELRIDALRLLGFGLFYDGRWDNLMPLIEGPLPQVLTAEELGRFEEGARVAGRADDARRISEIRAHAPQPLGRDFHAG